MNMKIKYYKNPYVNDKLYPRVIISRGDKGFAVIGGGSLMKGLRWSMREIRDFPGGEKDNRITRKQAEKMLGKGLRRFITELRNEPVEMVTYKMMVSYSFDNLFIGDKNEAAAKKVAISGFPEIQCKTPWGLVTMSPKICDCVEVFSDKK